MSDDAVATNAQVDSRPVRTVPDPNDPHTKLQKAVSAALQALPGEFESKNTISGVNATDLFSLNSFLGSSIELEVVRTLNSLRQIWDPDSEWSTYRFERSSQAFPDVRLVNHGTVGEEIAIGIELKGWWMLAKEKVPSLRYQVSPNACTNWDLVCCVPWHLDSAVSGVPVVVEPWVESAKYAAQWRDYWWQNIKETDGSADLEYPDDVTPYPSKADRVTVHPVNDSGGNFGRLPRCRPLMDSFIESTMQVPILGIETGAWVNFLRLHSESAGAEAVIEKLQRQLKQLDKKVAPDQAERILHQLRTMAELLP